MMHLMTFQFYAIAFKLFMREYVDTLFNVALGMANEVCLFTSDDYKNQTLSTHSK